MKTSRLLWWILGAIGLYFLLRPKPAAASLTPSAPQDSSNFLLPERLKEFMSDQKYQLSPAGLNLIKQFEGLSLTRYNDAAGFPTIGYGHLIKDGENYETITQMQAENLLSEDAMEAIRAVNANVTVPLTQNQFDALVSFTYNVGVDNFRHSTLLAMVNGGDFDGAAQQFGRWNRSGGQVIPGLQARREQEAQIFVT